MSFNYNSPALDSTTLIDLYKAMLKSRMIEEKMLILLRQGKISKWFSGIGQEAVAAGITLALNKDDYKLDQEYQMRLQQLHSRYLHTWGIVAGLEVKALEDSCTVEVTEGLALNQVTNDENAESISQQICIYEGHPDSIINVAHNNHLIFLAWKE